MIIEEFRFVEIYLVVVDGIVRKSLSFDFIICRNFFFLLGVFLNVLI